MQTRTLNQKKAVIAIAFAGGIVCSALPALSGNETLEGNTLINSIVDDSTNTPQVRSYQLLMLANFYLLGGKPEVIEKQFQMAVGSRIRTRWWHSQFNSTVDQLAIESHHLREDKSNKLVAEVKSKPQSNKNTTFAGLALKAALSQLEKCSDTTDKLSMYLMASLLFEKTGDTSQQSKCQRMLDNFLQACENSASVDEKNIKEASSILNIQAYGQVPLTLPNLNPTDHPWEKPRAITPTSEEFQNAENYKLKALALVDKLPERSDLRRKEHRDLSMWYELLGKTERAEKEKQALFKLVGSNDESLMYAQQGACGQLVWWQIEKVHQRILCGMG